MWLFGADLKLHHLDETCVRVRKHNFEVDGNVFLFSLITPTRKLYVVTGGTLVQSNKARFVIRASKNQVE